MGRRAGRIRVALAIAAALAVVAGSAHAEDVRGRVVLDLPGMQLADLGPIVVYLDAPAGGAASGAHLPAASLHQKNAAFAPRFLAVRAGQTVAMLNDDAIYHNVFSYSKPNDFDLGLYAAGQSKEVRFEHPGAVKLYCSIHESMNGTIFVAPTPWYDVVSPTGSFALRGVPAGRYVLRTWNEKLPDTERPLSVPSSAVEVPLVP
jgi:plastocyanin